MGVLGCGNVGSALLQMLEHEKGLIESRTGIPLAVTRVAVRNLSKDRPVELSPYRPTHDGREVVEDPEVDLVVELIGGIEPARTLILAALKAGKPVVTANKELLANVGGELSEVAADAGLDLLFEAAVAGAIPLIRPLRESLAGERVTRVMGIVNGTTNYILTRMSEARISYSEALSEAQGLGFAERDPTADVEGFDASAKAAIIAGIAFGREVVAGDVYREGISGISTDDISFAGELGYVVKLLAVAESADGADDSIGVRVHPAMIARNHPLASVRESYNAVFVEGENAGELMFYGRGAGGRPSASAVLGDVLDAAHNLREGGGGRSLVRRRARIRAIDELRCQYYVNIDVLDQPGVLASVAEVFGDNGVSIRYMEQVGIGDGARIVFITHTALERSVQATLHGLRKLEAVKRIGGILRVVGPE